MSRWISSALCTLAIVAVLFCLPFWGIRSASSSQASIVSDTTVSNVRIVQRPAKKAPAAVHNKSVPAVPAKPAETIPSPEEEAPPEQTEAAEESSDETAETSDEMQGGSAGGNAAGDASVSSGTDVFSGTRDAKAAATYKSYVLGRIASKKTYPYAARSGGLEGKVRARITINPDGTLADAVILEPSEYDVLNSACMAAIKKSAPFRKMTGGMSAMTLSFIMDFSLH